MALLLSMQVFAADDCKKEDPESPSEGQEHMEFQIND